MTDLRDAARQALEALAEHGAAYMHHEAEYRKAITALKAALEQKPKFTLSCGCPSQYGGVPAYWYRDGRTAFGMICEKHWHEYGARSEA
jgi:uncharacterized protein YgbK (DUF1537 family)